MLVPPKLRGSPTAPHSRRLEGHLRHRWQHSNSRRAHPPHCLHARAHPAWWRGNGAGCLRAGQVSCTLNTDRTRDSAGRKVGLRTTRKGEPPHPAVTNPIPLPRASLSFLVKQPGGLGCKLHSKCSKSERVVRSWSGLKCCTARTVRCAAIEVRRAAAFHADVQRVPELRFSASQEDFSVFQQMA